MASSSSNPTHQEIINMEVVVTSRDAIKPSHPTPQHLRQLPLSFNDLIFDQVFSPMIFFYSKGSRAEADDNLETSNHLKRSLAAALEKSYPFAGRVREYHIECNDEGVPYFEARAKCRLSQLVGQSSWQPAKLNNLLPYGLVAGDLPMAIQVNFFDCGGVAIGTCFSHKVADASSIFSFMNHWASVARGRRDTNLLSPRFESATFFPPRDMALVRDMTSGGSRTIAKRFVFSASALSALRSRYGHMVPTRVEALSAFIWTRFVAAVKGKAAATSTSWYAYFVVDFRTRMDPPLSENHIGNINGSAKVGSSRETSVEDGDGFIKRVREGIRRFDDKFIKNLQKAEFADQYLEANNGEYGSSLYFSSLSKFPMYEADFGFGWGRPVWVTMSGLYFVNSVVFMPTGRFGGGENGMEVLLYLREEDMARLESDKEFLQLVSPPPFGVKNLLLSSL